jgi:hypothetical protein
VPSDWLISDQEEELIRLLIVDSDYAEHLQVSREI